jgi:hypothetical protein
MIKWAYFWDVGGSLSSVWAGEARGGEGSGDELEGGGGSAWRSSLCELVGVFDSGCGSGAVVLGVVDCGGRRRVALGCCIPPNIYDEANNINIY